VRLKGRLGNGLAKNKEKIKEAGGLAKL